MVEGIRDKIIKTFENPISEKQQICEKSSCEIFLDPGDHIPRHDLLPHLTDDILEKGNLT